MAGMHVPQDIYQFRHFTIHTNTYEYDVPSSLPQRPRKFNTFGREAAVVLNTYNVVQSPSAIVNQYDVSVLLKIHN
jgi:eukaryotic translation initiation factor 2C